MGDYVGACVTGRAADNRFLILRCIYVAAGQVKDALSRPPRC